MRPLCNYLIFSCCLKIFSRPGKFTLKSKWICSKQMPCHNIVWISKKKKNVEVSLNFWAQKKTVLGEGAKKMKHVSFGEILHLRMDWHQEDFQRRMHFWSRQDKSKARNLTNCAKKFTSITNWAIFGQSVAL